MNRLQLDDAKNAQPRPRCATEVEGRATGPLAALQLALRNTKVHQAVLSSPETLAYVAGYAHPWEDWPIADPFLASPPLLVLGSDDRIKLLIADHYLRFVDDSLALDAHSYRSMTYSCRPDPAHEFAAALDRVLEAAGLRSGKIGIEASFLPAPIERMLRERGFEPCDIEAVAVEARIRKRPSEVERMRGAARLVDAGQQTMKDLATAGMTELELASAMTAAMWRAAGRRVPAILWLTAGAASASVGSEPTNRVIASGDIVLNDVVCWADGVWPDSANAVVVGRPTARQRQVFDSVRRALELGIRLCRPGVVARDIDRRVRESLADLGPTYPHHTGHGLGAAWSEEPRITPYNERRIEEDMILAVEPGVYLPGWGGIRLEHTFVVRAGGNEILTAFEHTL